MEHKTGKEEGSYQIWHKAARERREDRGGREVCPRDMLCRNRQRGCGAMGLLAGVHKKKRIGSRCKALGRPCLGPEPTRLKVEESESS
jgi:hypothetical protein